MNQIQRKVKKLQVEIRRGERQKIISKYRNDFINASTIIESFQSFLKQRKSEIPLVCLQGISIISQQMLQQFISTISSSVCFTTQGLSIADSWLFNCLSINNLKFMTELSKICQHKLISQRSMINQNPVYLRWNNFYNAFFKSTIKENEKYSSLSFNYQLQVNNSKCYIQAYYPVYQNEQNNSALSFLHQDYNQERWLALLQFWSTYMQLWDVCDIEDYVISIKAFLLWFEHTEIHQHQQAYFFIFSILKFIKQSKLLPNKSSSKSSQNNQEQLVNVLKIFLSRMKRCIPFAFAKKNFLHLGKIAIQFFHLSSSIHDLISEILYRSQTLVTYLSQILKLEPVDQNLQKIKVGLTLVYYYMSQNNVLRFNSPIQKVQIYRMIIKNFLFHRQLQYLVAMNLSQLALSDLPIQMKQLYEQIDFQRLLQQDNTNGQQFIYQLAISTLGLFRQNVTLHHKILNKGQLARKLRKFCETFEREEIYIDLIKEIDSNIEYFVDNYTNEVNQIIDYARELDFDGKEEFLNQGTSYIELKSKQAAL